MYFHCLFLSLFVVSIVLYPIVLVTAPLSSGLLSSFLVSIFILIYYLLAISIVFLHCFYCFSAIISAIILVPTIVFLFYCLCSLFYCPYCCSVFIVVAFIFICHFGVFIATSEPPFETICVIHLTYRGCFKFGMPPFGKEAIVCFDVATQNLGILPTVTAWAYFNLCKFDVLSSAYLRSAVLFHPYSCQFYIY